MFFVAIKAGGGGVTWGDARCDGNSSAISLLLTECVVLACVNERALATIKVNGCVVTWGPADHGGDSSAVAPLMTAYVIQDFGTDCFAAFKANGSL